MVELIKKTFSPVKIRILAVYISALVFSFIFVSILGQHTFRIEALEVRIGVKPALIGQTAVEIPPLATVQAKTHKTPVKITLNIESINFQYIQKMLDKKDASASMVSSVTDGLREAAILFALKILLLSAAGGALGVFLIQRTPGINYLRGAGTATLAAGLLLLGTYSSYDISKFKNPEYHGALKTAPWIIGLASETLDKIDTLNDKMEILADNVHQLYSQIDQLQVYGDSQEGVVKVLHVSDIHNNPAAMSYIQRIASLFKVDMIIDTGDITDYGTPLENLLLERLSGLKVPYLYVPGNHDSSETIKKMKSIPEVTILNGNTVSVKNLKITGFADPSSQSSDIEPPPLDMIPQHAGEFEESLSKQTNRPDILAIHNHRIARLMAGKAPVILFGHDHKISVEEEGGSIMIDAGSSGGAGLRRLQGDKTPYSVVLQYYAPENGKMVLKAADTITVKNLDSGFHLERYIFNATQ
ncbi:MAG: metallophosphoesterase family protein [Bacillota bacterium]